MCGIGLRSQLDDSPATFLCSTGGSCGAVTDPLVPYITPDAAFASRRRAASHLAPVAK